MIIAICDMPRQEFSLCERVYIYNTYVKSRKSCSEIRRKFRVKFPGRPVPNPSQLGDRLKDSKKQAPQRIEKSTVNVMFLQKKH